MLNSNSSKEIQKLVDEAATTRDAFRQDILSNSSLSVVRKALASNKNISREIANALSYDPTENVSYIACKNPKSTVFRHKDVSDLGSKCIPCLKVIKDVERCKTCCNSN